MRWGLRLCVLALAISTLTACGVPAGNYSSAQDQLSIQSVWQRSAGVGSQGAAMRLAPVLVNNVLYVPSRDGLITKLNASNGHVLDHIRTYQPISTGLLYHDGILFFGTPDAQIVAVSASDGSVLWRSTLSNVVYATPVIAHGHVIVETSNGVAYAFRPHSGHLLWDYTDQRPALMGFRLGGSPAVMGHKVLVGFSSGDIALLNADTGHRYWQHHTHPVYAAPGLYHHSAYAVTYNGHLLDYSSRGARRWQRAMSSMSGLVVTPRTVYVTDAAGSIWALSRNTGMTLWVQKKLAGLRLTAPAIIGDSVVIADSQGYISFLSRQNGRIMLRQQASDAAVYVKPLVSGNRVILTSADGDVTNYQVGF